MKSRWIAPFSFRLLAAGFLIMTAAQAPGQTADQILQQKPSQPDVTVDTPSADDIAKCKTAPFDDPDYAGKWLYGPDGTTPLRVICYRKNAKKTKETKVEEIRFFKNGVEVFRDNYVTQESRWLGDAGSRWGVRNKSGIENWKWISPEETSAEAVRALAAGDLARYKAVALSKEDLQKLGITGPLAEELTKQIDAIESDFGPLVTKLNLPEGVQWGAFNGNHPGLMPKGKNGLVVDLPIYYNAGVVLMENSEEQSKSHQISIGDMVKIGDVWKIVGLPTGEPFGTDSGQVAIGSIFFPAVGAAGTGAIPDAEGDYSEAADKLRTVLAELEQTPPDQAAAKCDEIFNLYIEIATKLPQERDNFIRESANFLMTEIRLGNYPDGVEKLEGLYTLLKNGGADRELIAFIRLRQIVGNYYAIMADKSIRPGDKMNAGDEYKVNLAAFADEYPRTDAAAEALMTLALDQEYVNENDIAVNYYSTVAKDFPNEAVGQKAAGAIQRLGSVGKEFSLPENWKLTDGSPVGSLATGKKTVLFCWASWSYNPDDFEIMKKIAARSDINVIGVSLDERAEDIQGILAETGNLPWKNVFVPGNAPDVTNSPTAVALGIQTAPMMILLDETGKTLLPNIMAVMDLEVRLDGLGDVKAEE